MQPCPSIVTYKSSGGNAQQYIIELVSSLVNITYSFLNNRRQWYQERINAISIEEREEFLAGRYRDNKAKLKASKFVTDMAAVVTDRDILITQGGHNGKLQISLKEYQDCMKANAQAYHSAKSGDAKQNITIAIVKHFTDQNRCFFFRHGEGEQIMLLSNDGAIATVQKVLFNASSSDQEQKEKRNSKH